MAGLLGLLKEEVKQSIEPTFLLFKVIGIRRHDALIHTEFILEKVLILQLVVHTNPVIGVSFLETDGLAALICLGLGLDTGIVQCLFRFISGMSPILALRIGAISETVTAVLAVEVIALETLRGGAAGKER